MYRCTFIEIKTGAGLASAKLMVTRNRGELSRVFFSITPSSKQKGYSNVLTKTVLVRLDILYEGKPIMGLDRRQTARSVSGCSYVDNE